VQALADAMKPPPIAVHIFYNNLKVYTILNTVLYDFITKLNKNKTDDGSRHGFHRLADDLHRREIGHR